jgi:FkbM family methyltransferase
MAFNLQTVLAHVPQPVLHRIGELQHRHPKLLPLAQRLNARFLGGDRVIAGGVGQGLRFNAQGGIASYTVGTAELVVQQQLERILKPGDVVYDIGASIGFITVICARLVGPTGRVIAFEPSPPARERLRHNIALNGLQNVTVIEAGVGEREGTAHLAGDLALVWGSLQESGADGGVEVRVLALDELDAERFPAPTLVKMDIEGGEGSALRGMTRVLREQRPVVLCETHDTVDEVRGLLQAQEYDVVELEGEGLSDDPRFGYVMATPRDS